MEYNAVVRRIKYSRHTKNWVGGGEELQNNRYNAMTLLKK